MEDDVDFDLGNENDGRSIKALCLEKLFVCVSKTPWITRHSSEESIRNFVYPNKRPTSIYRVNYRVHCSKPLPYTSRSAFIRGKGRPSMKTVHEMEVCHFLKSSEVWISSSCFRCPVSWLLVQYLRVFQTTTCCLGIAGTEVLRDLRNWSWNGMGHSTQRMAKVARL